MQTRKRSIFERIVSGALALTLACSGLMSNVSAAAAASPTPPDTALSAPASQPSSPTVVREFTEKRTETSKEFLLSDGTIRAQYFSGPVHYRDPQTHKMEQIDSSLETATVGGRQVAVNRANSFQVRLPGDLSNDEVAIEGTSTTISIRPRWKSRIGAALVSSGTVVARSVSATDRVYPDAFVGASLEYESRPEGLKETIVLDRPIKTNVFGFDLTLDGLTPHLEADRSISLFAVGTTETAYTIPAPFMMDSSGSTIGGDYTNAVHYEISGTGPTYHLDVVADAAWLADPARVYPVRIDPTITTSTQTQVGGNDTYISSAYQSTYYISHNLLWVDTHGPAADWTEYVYCQPHGALITDMASKKASGSYVVASRLKMPLTSQYIANGGSVVGNMCTTSTALSLPSLTWDTYQLGAGSTVGGMSTPYVDCSTSGTKIFDVSDMVAYWQQLALPQNECTVKLQGTTGTHIGFNSADNTGSKPVWEIDYSSTPVVAISAPTTGTVTSIPAASWTFTDACGFPQAEWTLEVATSATGAAIASTGAVNANTTATLPVPSGGFVPGTKYYVRVEAATAPTTQVPRIWSATSTSNFTLATTPVVVLSSPTTGTVTSLPTASWTVTDGMALPQAEWALEVATSSAGAAIATTGAVNANKTATLPIPSGGFVPGTKYYVRVKAATAPTTPSSRMWSTFSTGNFTLATTPVVSLSSPTTGTVTSGPLASWTFSDGMAFPQAEWILEVATSSAGAAIASTGAVNANNTAALPVPSGGFVPGTKYYVRVKAATAPTTPASRVWSAISTGNFTLATTPVVSLSSPTTGTVTSLPSASWTLSDGMALPQAEWILEVATSSAGAAIASTGAVNANNTAALPVPSGGFVPGTKYYVRVKAATAPTTPASRVWSTFATGNFTLATTPVVVLSSPTTGTVTSVPAASWTFSDGMALPQAEWALEVATSSAGAAIATTGAVNANKTAALPVPSGGFVPGTTYYVRVKAATAPTTPSSRVWSTFSTGNFTPAPPSAATSLSADTTASVEWFYESDTNGDGLNDLKDDAADQGRGSVALTWKPASGATGYNVYLFDGYAYRQVASTTATSWSTSGKGLYPTDSQIASLSAGTNTNPFLVGTGRDLRDDPRALYAKTAGTSMDATASYAFRVVPYNVYGEATVAAETSATLQNRTVKLNAEPQHTDYDLGEMLGHSATARLDQGTIELDATDLSIASWGPEAALSRHYSSETTIPGAFAPGWRFSFEQGLALSSSVATWTDVAGEAHRFAFVAGAWVAPDGLQATLSSTGGGYRIALPGGSRIDFDTAGRLVSESDLNDNTVSYVWTTNRLTIIAANAQMIDVFFNGTTIDRAEYLTSDGGRTVDYAYDFASEATVTLNPGTADELPVGLAYSSGYLQQLMGPATDGYSTVLSNHPSWEFAYSGSKLTGTGVGWGGWPSFPTSFDYGSREATVCVPRDTADGSPWDQSTYIRYEWNPSGAMSRRSDAQAVPDGWVGEPLPFSYWTYAYGSGNRLTTEVSPSLATVTRSYDSRGNMVTETDALGATTTSVYDGADRVVSETDPLGSTTYRSYDSTGNLTAEEKVLNVAGQRSRTEYSYDGLGRIVDERSKIDTSTWAQTTYQDFADNGEAQKTSNIGVKLSADASTQTLTSNRHYDEFGGLIWEKDATGRWVTKENVYSVSGRLLSSEVVTGTVSHTLYNQVGQAYESSTTAGGTYVNWIREGRDARGNSTGSIVVTASGDPVSAAQLDLDPQGSALGTSDQNGQHKSVQAFDASGRVVRSWAAGADSADVNAAARTTYDVEGRTTVTLAPGAVASQATTTTYDLLGRTAEVTNPDGTWVRYEYDKAGNVVKETSSADSAPSVKTTQYDLMGRAIKTTDAVGAQTTTAYDLQGRVVDSGIVGEGGSQVAYNTLGQVLSQTDVDGITSKTYYDAAGRVEKIEVAGKATVTEYDPAGRVSKVTDPDGLSVEKEYNAFSGVTIETHRRNTVILKQTTTDYDVLGRVSKTSQTAGGVRNDISYNGVSGKPLSASIRYAESTTSVEFRDTDGAELGRTFAMASVSTSRAVTRDVQGRVTALTVPGLGTRGTGYDASGKITSQTGFGFTGSGATYGYGESGRKTSESLSLDYPGATYANSYGYTAAGRLSTASVDGTTTSYRYDDAGNLDLVTKGGVDTTLTYDQASRKLMAMGTTEFGWDQAQGRRTSMRRSGEASVTYEYTDAGRLARFANPNSSTSASYTYGAQGQRDSSVVTVGSLTTTTTYVYDGLSLLNLAAQRSDGETYSITYSYGEDQRAWAAVYASSDTSSPTIFHPVTTDRGDVVELTDASGAPFAAYRYDAWGKVLSESSQATGSLTATLAADITARQPLRYAGYCYDAESSTYYLSARQYDPAAMQFLTKDPARADGEESAYQYCGGDPAGKVDPSGLGPEIALAPEVAYAFLAAAAVIAVYSATTAAPLYGGIRISKGSSKFAYGLTYNDHSISHTSLAVIESALKPTRIRSIWYSHTSSPRRAMVIGTVNGSNCMVVINVQKWMIWNAFYPASDAYIENTKHNYHYTWRVYPYAWYYKEYR